MENADAFVDILNPAGELRLSVSAWIIVSSCRTCYYTLSYQLLVLVPTDFSLFVPTDSSLLGPTDIARLVPIGFSNLSSGYTDLSRPTV